MRFIMKTKVKARVNPQGYMGSSVRIEKPKKGKGSFRRHSKHKQILWTKN